MEEVLFLDHPPRIKIRVRKAGLNFYQSSFEKHKNKNPQKARQVENCPDALIALHETSLFKHPSEANTVSLSTSHPLHMPEIPLLDRLIPALLHRTTDIPRQTQLIILAILATLAIRDRIIPALVLPLDHPTRINTQNILQGNHLTILQNLATVREILAILDHQAQTPGPTIKIELVVDTDQQDKKSCFLQISLFSHLNCPVIKNKYFSKNSILILTRKNL